MQYEVAKGQILLEHAYPKDASPTPQVWVDINLVLESTKSSTLAPGTWVNVVGYVQTPTQQSRKKSATTAHRADEAAATLQAVLAWDAGALRIAEYEHILEEQKRADRQSSSNRR